MQNPRGASDLAKGTPHLKTERQAGLSSQPEEEQEGRREDSRQEHHQNQDKRFEMMAGYPQNCSTMY